MQIMKSFHWNHKVYTWSERWRRASLYISACNQRSSALKNKTNAKASRWLIFPLLRMIRSDWRISFFLATRRTINPAEGSPQYILGFSCRPRGRWYCLSCQRILLAMSQIYIFIYKKHVLLAPWAQVKNVLFFFFWHRILESPSTTSW